VAQHRRPMADARARVLAAPRRQDAPVAQLDRAPDYESGGRTFESFRARHSHHARTRSCHQCNVAVSQERSQRSPACSGERSADVRLNPEAHCHLFRGNERLDVDAMLAPFAEDAVVSDENRTHRGRQAIRTWIEEATIGNRAIAIPQSATLGGASQGNQKVTSGRPAGWRASCPHRPAYRPLPWSR
jgi:hypothetical protein